MSEVCLEARSPKLFIGGEDAGGNGERGPKLQAPSVWFRFSWVCDADGRALGTGKPFAKNFRETIGRLFRRLFRVYAHLYSNHFDHICALGIEGA